MVSQTPRHGRIRPAYVHGWEGGLRDCGWPVWDEDGFG